MELEKYPPAEQPTIAVDAVLFTIIDNALNILLITRKRDPFKDCYAIPGAFLRVNETCKEAVKRVMQEKGGVNDIPYMEQLYTFDEPRRDPRGRVISVSYFSLVNERAITIAETSSQARWFDVNALPPLAFDHARIIEYAVKRLQWKIEYTTTAFALLPDEFTLSSIKHIYEAILGKTFTKGNFWRKFLSLGILKETGTVEKTPKTGQIHRPGKLYKLDATIGDIVPIF